MVMQWSWSVALALAARACFGRRERFDPANEDVYLPRVVNESAAELAEAARGRFEALASVAEEMRCRAPVVGHKRSGFGSYLRILCHEAEASLARGMIPEPLLQHELLSSGSGRVGRGVGSEACGRRELSSCVVASRFAHLASKPLCRDVGGKSRESVAEPERGSCFLRSREGGVPGRVFGSCRSMPPRARKTVDEYATWASRNEFWSSAALFSALLRPRASG